MIQWIKLQAKLKSSCKSKKKVKCTVSTFSTSIIFEFQDVMYCLPVQEDPVHASSSTPSPEHSTVAHVRLLVFLPFFNDHALHGTHSPYSVKNCFSNWENNQMLRPRKYLLTLRFLKYIQDLKVVYLFDFLEN